MKIENLLKDAKGTAISRVHQAITEADAAVNFASTDNLFSSIAEEMERVRAMERRAQRLADDLDKYLSI